MSPPATSNAYSSSHSPFNPNVAVVVMSPLHSTLLVPPAQEIWLPKLFHIHHSTIHHSSPSKEGGEEETLSPSPYPPSISLSFSRERIIHFLPRGLDGSTDAATNFPENPKNKRSQSANLLSKVSFFFFLFFAPFFCSVTSLVRLRRWLDHLILPQSPPHPFSVLSLMRHSGGITCSLVFRILPT